MVDNQFKLITFIFLILISSVRCKNSKLSLDDSNDWNNVASNDLLINNRFLLPSINRQNLKIKYDLLNQPFYKREEENLFNLNDDKKTVFKSNFENEQDYRSKLNRLKPQNVFDLNSNEQISPFYLRLLSNLERPTEQQSGDKLKNFKNLFNRPLTENDGDIMNRKARSDQLNKQRSYAEYQPMNLFDQDLFHSSRPNSENENNLEKQGEEIAEMMNIKSKKTGDEQARENNRDKSAKHFNKKGRSTKQLLTNNSNDSPSVVEQSQSLSKSTSSNSISNPLVPRKNKWINRVSKSTSFRGNNVSDCIKNCVSQGILHPVQCHSLC